MGPIQQTMALIRQVSWLYSKVRKEGVGYRKSLCMNECSSRAESKAHKLGRIINDIKKTIHLIFSFLHHQLIIKVVSLHSVDQKHEISSTIFRMCQ